MKRVMPHIYRKMQPPQFEVIQVRKNQDGMVSKKTPGGNGACDDETMHIGDRSLHIVVEKGGPLNTFR